MSQKWPWRVGFRVWTPEVEEYPVRNPHICVPKRWKKQAHQCWGTNRFFCATWGCETLGSANRTIPGAVKDSMAKVREGLAKQKREREQSQGQFIQVWV